MNILYLPNGQILAAGSYTDTETELRFSDVVVPKSAAPGWQIADVAVPAGFTPARYTYLGGVLTPLPAPTPAVPDRITGWRGRAVMELHGLDTAIRQAIAAIPNTTTRTIAEQGYTSADEFVRTGPLLNSILKGLGKTDAEIDAYFIEAAALPN